LALPFLKVEGRFGSTFSKGRFSKGRFGSTFSKGRFSKGRLKVDLGSGSSGDLDLDSLGEVGAHVLLEVEVSKLISLLELKKAGKLGVGVDLATIGLVLEIVVTDVNVNLTSHLSASHLSAGGLLEERGKLIADPRGLHEARGGAIAGLALTLGALLLGRAELASPLLLKNAVLGLKSGEESAELLELSKELNRLLSKRSNINFARLSDSVISGGGLNGDGSNLLLSLLNLGGLIGNGIGNGLSNGSSVGGLNGLSGSYHYTLLRRLLFK